MQLEKWIAGAEYDEALLAKIGEVLRDLGYSKVDQSYGIGGSQEISRWEVIGPKGILAIEAETYIGLSLEGPSVLVAEVKRSLAISSNPSFKRMRDGTA